jgi:hypothetical protein
MITVNAGVKMTRNVQNAIRKAAPKTLKQAGRYTWSIARSLIKQRRNPDDSSAPGTAPHSHQGGMNAGFKKTIVYALAPDKKSVVIGPKLVRKGLSNIARLHEFGGSRQVQDIDPKLMDGVEIGETGPVTWTHLSRYDSIVHQDPQRDPRTGRKVVWIRIRTKSQAAHSSRLYRRLKKHDKKMVYAQYPQRPYMSPALRLSRPKLSEFWKNSVKK